MAGSTHVAQCSNAENLQQEWLMSSVRIMGRKTTSKLTSKRRSSTYKSLKLVKLPSSLGSSPLRPGLNDKSLPWMRHRSKDWSEIKHLVVTSYNPGDSARLGTFCSTNESKGRLWTRCVQAVTLSCAKRPQSLWLIFLLFSRLLELN